MDKITYCNQLALMETLDRVIQSADTDDAANLKQIKDYMQSPLKLFAFLFLEAEFQLTELVGSDILTYEENDMKESIVKLANKLYNECETFNDGSSAAEITENFWEVEKQLYV